ncbi:MAG TPA: penicillin acylase family protein, partial [Roseococcus sp.]|nr:penicillin acylase family protein [Roseococcus sp.]
AIWWTLPSRPVGLAAAVAFDADGVPTIRAASERDAAIALGYLHARDRLFQMEMMRRNAEGRLSELAGPATLRLDRFHRTLGLAGRAEADYAALLPDTRAILDAYAEGVNLLIRQRGRFASPEFLPLGTPEPWRPAQSLLWAKTMGLYLSNNWRTEIERASLAARLPPERLWELWPLDSSPGRPDVLALDGPRPAPVRAAEAPALPGVATLLAQLPVFGTDAPLPSSASNAWAVSRGVRGAPILASDPHLSYGAPVIWYLARIELPERTLRGATSPGVPFVVIGRSHDLAWGFTTTHSDTQDVFIEDEAAVTASREEVIRVRGAPDHRLRIRETRNGPVISDLDPGQGRMLAVRMANLEPNDSAATGLLALNRAASLAEARAAAALIASPPQNLMLADRHGGIAMFLTGRVPIRAEGHDGALPARAAPWQGFVPFDALPHAGNPASGRLVNANNRIQPPPEPGTSAEPYLGRDWFGDWRFRRIHERLDAAPASLDGSAAIQMDAVSLLAREALPVLAALPRGSGALATAQALLANWDGGIRADAAQPLIWNAFARRLQALAFRRAGVPDAPDSAEFLRFLLHDEGAAWWCGGDCRALAGIALAEVVGELAARLGTDPEAWRWGALHVARFEHPLLRFVPVLGRLTSLAAPVSGDNETVQRQGMRGTGWTAIHGSGLRFVADMADADSAHLVIATGQSGHPLSRHWGDWLARWRDGP